MIVTTLPPFWEFNPHEPSVQIAIRDWCRPGDVIYDVGTNIGGLAAVMSRAAGPRGVVAAFEASPRIVGVAAANLQAYHNVHLYHCAVWRASGERLTLYSGGDHLNDSLLPDHQDPGAQPSTVKTLALDDFRADTGLDPAFIKMDIEGAEFEALLGADRLLSDCAPVLVLEVTRTDPRAIDHLLSRNYRAVDLADLRAVRSALDIAEVGVSNVLFAPAARTAHNPYFAGPEQEEVVANFSAEDFAVTGDSIRLKTPKPLKAGRYAFRAAFQPGARDDVFAGVRAHGKWVTRYQAPSAKLAAGFTNWMFDLDHDGAVDFGMEFLAGGPHGVAWPRGRLAPLRALFGLHAHLQPRGVTWEGGRLTRYRAFDAWPRRRVY